MFSTDKSNSSCFAAAKAALSRRFKAFLDAFPSHPSTALLTNLSRPLLQTLLSWRRLPKHRAGLPGASVPAAGSPLAALGRNPLALGATGHRLGSPADLAQRRSACFITSRLNISPLRLIFFSMFEFKLGRRSPAGASVWC